MSYLILLLLSLAQSTQTDFLSKAVLRQLRDETQEMFYHAYNNYLEHAFPDDELKPISCSGRRPEGRGTLDDTLGNLDTLLIFGDTEGFIEGVKRIIDEVRFDSDATVSVFETTIRVLGGLLSSHLLVADRNLTREMPWYDGQLLHMAEDLGKRLLPAFNTKTGLPLSRINLRHGLLRGENDLTCTSCAGTLALEFGLLSRLTGNKSYENAAMKSLQVLLESKSNIGLFGSMINTTSGVWAETLSSVGAGSDSFYEYIYKTYLYFDLSYQDFTRAYQSALMYLRTHDDWYLVSNMFTGHTAFQWTDSLAAFWPGLQVDIGDVEVAQRGHKNYLGVWMRYDGIPERYSVFNKAVVGGMQNYPLRPEFIESTYLLYRATKDPFYQNVGQLVVQSLRNLRVKCGYASVSDVQTLRVEDRMDSFFLAETLKYLFLLFDDNNWIHKSNYLFTTEAHLFPFNQKWHRQAKNIANDSCPIPPLKRYDYLQMLPLGRAPKKVDWPMCSIEAVPPTKMQLQLSGIKRGQVGQFGVTQVESSREVVIGVVNGNSINGTFYGQTALFGSVLKEPLVGQLARANPLDLCLPSTVDLMGKIAFLYRGGCTFHQKALNAQNAGAIGVVIVNPNPVVFSMSGAPDMTKVHLPAIMITGPDGAYLLHLLESALYSEQTISISPKNFGKSRQTSFLQFVFKGSAPSVFRNLSHQLQEQKMCPSQAFVNEDSIIFSLSNQGLDLSNSRIDITWSDKSKNLQLQLIRLELV